jgi:uncharacterized membrane protein HdeD (DUF308 family)
MTAEPRVPEPLRPVRGFTKLWWLVIAVGLLGVVAGVVVLAIPDIGLATLAVVAGIFLLADGIVEVVAALGPGWSTAGCSPSWA